MDSKRDRLRNMNWTEKKLSLLKRHYPLGMDLRKLAGLIGTSFVAVKSKATILKLRRNKQRKTQWSNYEKDYIIAKYPDTLTEKIANHLGLTVIQVYRFAHKNGLKKTIEFKYSEESGCITQKNCAERGAEFRFKKGHTPWTKGLKGLQIKGSEKGWFRKGHVPAGTLSDGHITIRHNHKERNAAPYKWIRISKGKWKMLHVFNWEKKHGPVPKGKIIVFKDGDTMNCDPDNLMDITRAEHAERCRTLNKYIAARLAQKNPELREEFLKHPELIEAKKQQYILNRKIKEHEKANV